MAIITEYLKKILSARYGEEVRGSIHDSIEAINNNVEDFQDTVNETVNNNTVRQDLLEEKYNAQIANIASGEYQNAEIVDARSGFGSLGDLLKKKVYHFDTVADMKACKSLYPGDLVQTAGYYKANDGGAGLYKIIISMTIEADEINYLELENGMIAELIPKEIYFINSDYTQDIVQAIFNIERPKIITFVSDFTFTKTMRLNANTKIVLGDRTITFDIPSVNEDYTKSHGFFNFKDSDEFLEYNGNGNIEIKGGTIEGGNLSFCHAKNIKIDSVHFLNCLNDHILEMCAINNLIVHNCMFQRNTNRYECD